MAKLERPRKPLKVVPLVGKDGMITPEWDGYFARLEDYAASLEARIKALEP